MGASSILVNLILYFIVNKKIYAKVTVSLTVNIELKTLLDYAINLSQPAIMPTFIFTLAFTKREE